MMATEKRQKTTQTRRHLELKWTTSRARDTYGYNVCSLYVDGKLAARCNGGGYDMEGTCLGDFIAKEYAERLRCRIKEEFYGLSFHDPDFDPGKVVLESGKTVEQAEADHESLGLDRYQAFYSGSAKLPSKRHRIPLIDGACGKSCVEKITNAIGLTLEYVPVSSKNLSIYTLIEGR